MPWKPTLGTSIVLLVVIYVAQLLLLGDFYPNHELNFLIGIGLTFLIYFAGLSVYYYSTESNAAEETSPE